MECKKFFHNLLIEQGGFRLWFNTYKDMLFDRKANDKPYNLWRKSALKLIPDPKKVSLLTPKKPPSPMGYQTAFARAEL
jgi:hypothetical protein